MHGVLTGPNSQAGGFQEGFFSLGYLPRASGGVAERHANLGQAGVAHRIFDWPQPGLLGLAHVQACPARATLCMCACPALLRLIGTEQKSVTACFSKEVRFSPALGLWSDGHADGHAAQHRHANGLQQAGDRAGKIHRELDTVLR